MKKLSQLDSYLNESLQTGRTDSESGMGFVTVKKTDDGMGFNVTFCIEGSAREGELPSDAQAKMKKALDDIEKIVMKELDWLM